MSELTREPGKPKESLWTSTWGDKEADATTTIGWGGEESEVPLVR